MEEWQGYEKIRRFRDNQKQQTELKYKESVAVFEEHAEHLYELLKQKESIEEAYKKSLVEPTKIATLSSYHQYLYFLTPAILQVQQKVDQARGEMQKLQEKVSEDYIEVKKIDKIIEKKKEASYQIEKRNEALMMDEISLRQFMHK